MKIIAGNWKFNKELRNLEKAINFVEALEEKISGFNNVEVKIFPHDSVLPQLAKKVEKIKIGAQDIHWEEDGSFTGAPFSAKDLISMGVKEVLIGHSETRAYFGVTDEKVSLKLKAALNDGIIPTICIGEDIEEKERGETEGVLRRQIEKGILPALAIYREQFSENSSLQNEVKSKSSFMLAYEPLYAIAGFAKLRGLEPKSAQIGDIKPAIGIIRKTFSENGYPEIKILYGGSSNPENARELLSHPCIDGLLLGTASWNFGSFFEMIKVAEEISLI
ncbi:triose-phosphate isomerase [Patescibacteria group bacterium]|nr:triose-phosphate isomerase [Patescibacteria group bacterium]